MIIKLRNFSPAIYKYSDVNSYMNDNIVIVRYPPHTHYIKVHILDSKFICSVYSIISNEKGEGYGERHIDKRLKTNRNVI